MNLYVGLLDTINAIRSFLELGGPVLILIMITTFLMWVLIVERYWYLATTHRQRIRQAIATWNKVQDTRSFEGRSIRRALISEVSEQLKSGMPMIGTLVALCPLLGLLGTVTGMVEVFQTMAVLGSGEPRAMASGVSKATIPTMAGMVAAISGLFFNVQLKRRREREVERLEDALTRH